MLFSPNQINGERDSQLGRSFLAAILAVAALACSSLVAGCGGGSGSSQLSERQEQALTDTIQARVQEMATTWSALRPEPYLNLYSDDVQFYFQGAESSRAEFEKEVRKLMAAYQTYSIEPAPPQIDVLAPDAAVASFRYKGRAVDTTGEARDVTAAMTLVYERRSGAWKIIQAHESLPPPETSS
ncbi:MAG: SgcJ/EcaC family oxidoreductase [Salinivenus sp.]